jgi:hypothetical protein
MLSQYPQLPGNMAGIAGVGLIVSMHFPPPRRMQRPRLLPGISGWEGFARYTAACPQGYGICRTQSGLWLWLPAAHLYYIPHISASLGRYPSPTPYDRLLYYQW